MRDVNRIDNFCEELKALWKRVPDWRFGQLISNTQRFARSDMYYYEEDKFLKVLKEFLEGAE